MLSLVSTESTSPPIILLSYYSNVLDVLIQPNNIWTSSNDGSTTVLAESQPNRGPPVNPGDEEQWKKMNAAAEWLDIHVPEDTALYKIHTPAYLGLPCHSGAIEFWQPVCCLLSSMSVWLCHPPWQAWRILWFLVVLELLYYQKNKKKWHFPTVAWKVEISSVQKFTTSEIITRSHLEQWGRL